MSLRLKENNKIKWWVTNKKSPANEISNDNEDKENVYEQTKRKGKWKVGHINAITGRAWKLNAPNKNWLAER